MANAHDDADPNPVRATRNWQSIVRAHLGTLPLMLDAARANDVLDEMAQHVAEEHAELVAGWMADEVAFATVMGPLRERARVAAEIARADKPRPAAPLPPATKAGPLTGL